MATEVRSALNVIRHDNHAPPASLTARTFVSPQLSNFLMISNTSAVTVYVSFDGTNLFTINSGGVFVINFSCQKQYWTKGDGVASVEVIIGSEI